MNPRANKLVENVVKASLENTEKKLDAELAKLENLDSKDLLELRRKRMTELQKTANQKQDWLQKGHGKYEEVYDQKEWFNETKNNDRVICHFFRPTTARCEIVDKHLAILAPRHMEARFIKINAEKAPFLCERLNVRVLPTIMCTRTNKTVDLVVGFDELGGTDTFSTEALEARLSLRGTLDRNKDADEDERKAAAEQRRANPIRSGGLGGAPRSAEDDAEDDAFLEGS